MQMDSHVDLQYSTCINGKRGHRTFSSNPFASTAMTTSRAKAASSLALSAMLRSLSLSLSACNNVIKSNYRGYAARRQRDDDYRHDRQSRPDADACLAAHSQVTTTLSFRV